MKGVTIGRPTKLSPEVADAVVKAVGEGLPRRTAAHLAGVSVSVLYAWLRAGRKRQGKRFMEFLHRVKRAEAEAVAGRVRQISRAALAGTWQAAAWWLERRHPDEFGTERKRIRELEKLLADIVRERNGPPLTDEQRLAGLTALLGRMGLAVVPADSVNGPPPQPEGGKTTGSSVLAGG